jgi:hypothetical protein
MASQEKCREHLTSTILIQAVQIEPPAKRLTFRLQAMAAARLDHLRRPGVSAPGEGRARDFWGGTFNRRFHGPRHRDDRGRDPTRQGPHGRGDHCPQPVVGQIGLSPHAGYLSTGVKR